jgi:hypothetical protein
LHYNPFEIEPFTNPITAAELIEYSTIVTWERNWSKLGEFITIFLLKLFALTN